MYFEETEMQYRYHRAGYAMYIVPEPQIIHLESASTKRQNAVTSRVNTSFSTVFYVFEKAVFKAEILCFQIVVVSLSAIVL